MSEQSKKAYWQKNLKYLIILLSAWFLVSFVCGILFAPYLNQYSIGGFKLGFWFAQQGSMLFFILIIFIYVRWMNKMDDDLEAENEAEKL